MRKLILALALPAAFSVAFLFLPGEPARWL